MGNVMERNQISRKGLTFGIILLFIGTSIIPSTAQNIWKPSLLTSRGNWLYVGGSGPGNYTKIQDAVNASSDGDTVFVFDDSSPYCEEITIEKSINLIGENHDTIIDGMNDMGDGIEVHHEVSYITISCFSIINFDGIGIVVYGNNVIISNIHFINNRYGLFLVETKNNIISNNLFKNCHWCGLYLRDVSHCIISQNEITGSKDGIYFDIPCSDNTISNNEIINNINGIYFYAYHFNLYNRYDWGESIKNTIVQYNNITDNSIGINIFGKFKNSVIKNNNFIENNISVSYKTFLFQRFRINANFWGETELSYKVLPGYYSIYLYTKGYPGEHTAPKPVFLYIPKKIFDWHPAQEPYDVP